VINEEESKRLYRLNIQLSGLQKGTATHVGHIINFSELAYPIYPRFGLVGSIKYLSSFGNNPCPYRIYGRLGSIV